MPGLFVFTCGEEGAKIRNRQDRRGSTRLLGLLAVLSIVISACRSGETAPPEGTDTPTSPEPTAIPTSFSEPESFSSTVYGYTISYPGGWSVTEATRSLSENELPEPGTPGADTFVNPEGRLELSVGAKRDTRGMTLDDWTGSAQRLVEAATHCEPSELERARIGGEPAHLFLYQGCVGFDLQWASVIRGKRAFLILWRNDSGTQAAHRPLFEDVLESIRFGR